MLMKLQKNLPIIIGSLIASALVMIMAWTLSTKGSSRQELLGLHPSNPVVNITKLNRPTLHTQDTTIKQRKGFINKIGYPAIKAYQKHQNYQVLPSVVIAQAIVESNWGTSGLCTQAHNIFGVKGAYNGQSDTMKTMEVINGNKVYKYAAFRKYPSYEASILDHDYLLQHQFIRRNQDMNYKQVCHLLQNHDYATDPHYANTLIRTIQTYHLYRYDKIGLS